MGDRARRSFLPDRAAVASQCQSPPPPALAKGIEEFNRRQFFECHETLEELWIAERVEQPQEALIPRVREDKGPLAADR